MSQNVSKSQHNVSDGSILRQLSHGFQGGTLRDRSENGNCRKSTRLMDKQILFPMSSGASEASSAEPANELAVQANERAD